MATANNTIKTRIQLKSDTEANWNKAAPKDNSPGFVPLNGELIIYSADNAHPFSRLKVGDGQTNVVSLPFIDAGTLNGDEAFLLKYANYNSFPNTGATDKLYIDLATTNIYHYVNGTGYIRLSQLQVSTSTIHDVVFWGPGSATTVSVVNGVLTVKNGVAPQLLTADTTVVTNVVGGLAT